MTKKVFGTPVRSATDFINEIQRMVGEKFPIEIQVSDSKIIHFAYETTWKEGGTKPREVTDKKGNTTIEYDLNHKSKVLTSKQIETIDNWVKKEMES